jgi:hypothetical protein
MDEQQAHRLGRALGERPQAMRAGRVRQRGGSGAAARGDWRAGAGGSGAAATAAGERRGWRLRIQAGARAGA